MRTAKSKRPMLFNIGLVHGLLGSNVLALPESPPRMVMMKARTKGTMERTILGCIG